MKIETEITEKLWQQMCDFWSIALEDYFDFTFRMMWDTKSEEHYGRIESMIDMTSEDLGL